MGQVYSELNRERDHDGIARLLAEHGFFLAGFTSGIDPWSVDLMTSTARIRYDIRVAVVGAILITGNTATATDAILPRLCLQPGKVLSQDALNADYARLNELASFENIELVLKPGPDPRRPWEKTLNWNLTEGRLQRASFTSSAQPETCPSPIVQ